MKTNTTIRTIAGVVLCMTSFGTKLQAQTYCTPPPFSSGPYTGITNVTLGILFNTSPHNDGVKYFIKTAVAKLPRNSNQEISVTTFYGISGSGFSNKLSVRVWIDWNQDGDFADADEEVLKKEMVDPGLTKQSFKVPVAAALGKTRMRVYNDMPPVDGHDPATYCGYLGSPNLALGQHGEVEDYNVEVTAVSSVEGSASLVKATNIFPNPATDFATIQVAISEETDLEIDVIDIQGRHIQKVFTGNKTNGSHLFSIATANLTSGIYLVKITANGVIGISKLQIVH